jgi:hypothetical protein
MNLVDRVKNILLQPKAEWPAIAAEPATAPDLYKGYIAPLAAIEPVASIIGLSLIGISMPMMGNFRIPLGQSITHAVVRYVLALVAVYILALVIAWLAPRFAGTPDRSQALKPAAYAYTPAWLAGIFVIIPWLGILGLIAAFYGLYLFYTGLPVLMRSPRERTMPYFLSILAVTIVLGIAFAAIANLFIGGPRM